MTETDEIMMELVERVTRTETRFEEHHKEVLARLDALNEHGEERDIRIRALEDSLTRYKGFWGALSIIGSAIAAAWALFGDWFRVKFFG